MTSCSNRALLLSALPILFTALQSSPTHAAAPILYRQPAYESPVRGEPDDLLLLAGFGFAADDTVVYRALATTSDLTKKPSAVPGESTAAFGIAPIINSKNVPYSLTIRLPDALTTNQTYALWVRTATGEWSEPIKINDARPLWISPAYVYSSTAVASLPRYVKVIGRNLQPASGKHTQLRLKGPETLVLTAQSSEQSTLDHFVALAQLPAVIKPGSYRVELSRDGMNWIELAGTMVQVQPDPARDPQFPIDDTRFGHCRPDDGIDDTLCIVRAIAAAAFNGSGSIVFGPGAWDLIEVPPGLGADGIVLPHGINLVGKGSGVSRINRHPQWNAKAPTAAFTLTGGNSIRELTLKDLQTYRPTDRAGPFLQLGRTYQEGEDTNSQAKAVSDVVITKNVFDKTMVAIGSGGLPIERLFVTYNEFGSYRASLEPDGNRYNMTTRFRVDDSVAAFNTFKPGSYIYDRSGGIASEIGASQRLDFSNNTADGSSTDYLYSPDDARGWRAAFFWHMNNNHEFVLVSQNVATCTGDKIADGESIAYDNNANTFAFDSAVQVVGATSDTVIVSGIPLDRQNNRKVKVDSYYEGHWIQVGAGPGIGQVRKIKSYAIDRALRQTTFNIAPSWDVVPVAAKTRLSVGREFWQVYTVANTVDNRRPLCAKSNRTAPKAGVIALWAQTADSAVDGNRQFDSDGIVFLNQFTSTDPHCDDCYRGTAYFNFVEIRNNRIDGEYDWATDCSSSGIFGSLAASPGAPPLTVNYGVSISHNVIRQADAARGGGIALAAGWYEGPAPHRWPLVDGLLVHHNELQDFWDSRPRRCGHFQPPPRTGISLGGSSLVWRPTLYANECGKIPLARNLVGVQDALALCKNKTRDYCECAN